MGGLGSAPMLPPNPQDAITASRRGKGRIVARWVVFAVIVLTAVGLGTYFMLRTVAVAAGGSLTVSPSYKAAAALAQSADETARRLHISDASSTLGLLDEQHSKVRWLPANDPSPFSEKRTYVSISVGGDHVLTAVDAGFCTYGLTVSAPGDPIIARDQLPGIGTYWTISPRTEGCSANSAPKTGWSGFDLLLHRPG